MAKKFRGRKKNMTGKARGKKSWSETAVPESAISIIMRRILVPLMESGQLSVSEAGLFCLISMRERELTMSELTSITHQARTTVLRQIAALKKQIRKLISVSP
jgi:hypothetical protein